MRGELRAIQDMQQMRLGFKLGRCDYGMKEPLKQRKHSVQSTSHNPGLARVVEEWTPLQRFKGSPSYSYLELVSRETHTALAEPVELDRSLDRWLLG